MELWFNRITYKLFVAARVSHDETIIRRLRKDPDFAAEYLKASLEDDDEPRVSANRAAPSRPGPENR